MRTLPDAVELLEVIAEYIRGVSKKGAAPDSFHLLVAANSLDIVRREIEQGAGADEGATARIENLLGETGDLHALEDKLNDAIASGRLATGSPELLDHLLRSAMDEVAIDQPRYATYDRLRRLMDESQTSDPGGVHLAMLGED